nr:phosphate ABC transporter permease subunit PstC [Candidatus Njordarchaeota archaeon]
MAKEKPNKTKSLFLFFYDKIRKFNSHLINGLRTFWKNRKSADLWFQVTIGLIACSVFVIIGLMVLDLLQQSTLSITTYGLSFLQGTTWQPFPPDPNAQPAFGALPPIAGTVVTSGVALLLGVPISLGIALALSEFAPRRFGYVVSFLVELLAAIPSVIYGLWGIFVLMPFLTQNVYPFLQKTFGFLPFFQGRIGGFNVLTAGIILAIMIVPTVSAISRDAFAAVPESQREAFVALGATRWETARFVVGYSRSGVIGAVVLGLGRAVGETMAVTMVIGNSFQVFGSLFDPATTLASVIANEFREATSPPIYVSAIMEIGLILFMLALVINLLARLTIRRSMRMTRGAELL